MIMPQPPQVLFIAPWLPKLSETFVYRELFGLRDSGVSVLGASVHAPELVWDEPRLQALAGEVAPVYGPGPLRLLLDAALETLGHPVSALRTGMMALGDAVRGRDISGLGRVKVLWQALAGLALARRIRGRGGVGHIHAHMAHVATTIAMYAAGQLGVGFSFTGHAADIFRDRSLLAEKLRRAAFVSCISRWHRAFYKAIVDRTDGEYPVIRCGVDVSEFAPSHDSPAGVLSERPLILAVGRLVPKKGFDLLLRAVAAIRDQGLQMTCCIVGDGPEREALHRLAADLDLGDVLTFLDSRPNSEVREHLRQAAIFVLPCRTDASGDKDGIPVVLMEAMACGVCAISGDLPTIRELIDHRKNGFLVPPDDVPALAHCLEELLADPDLRKHITARGRLRIQEEFALDVNVGRLRSALESVEMRKGGGTHARQ
jgi:colanic acid/amylovoran biosynthesis glycosyltransferase